MLLLLVIGNFPKNDLSKVLENFLKNSQLLNTTFILWINVFETFESESKISERTTQKNPERTIKPEKLK